MTTLFAFLFSFQFFSNIKMNYFPRFLLEKNIKKQKQTQTWRRGLTFLRLKITFPASLGKC